MVHDYRSLAADVRKRSQSSVLTQLAIESAVSLGNHMRSPDSLAYMKTFPWANIHVARLALSNGTDFKRPPATERDIVRFKEAFHALDPGSERGDIWTVATRMLHEQMPLQADIGHELARSYLLYGVAYPGCAPLPWSDVFGVSLERRVRAVLLLWGGALEGQGQVDRAAILNSVSTLREAPQDLGGDVEDTIQDLCQPVSEFRSAHVAGHGMRDVPDVADENPLLRYPIVELADGRLVVPSVPHLLRTVYSEGLYYRGGDAWGNGFTRDSGPRVEAVAGLDLSLLRNAEVIREIVYDEGASKSVDWIVVFPECVLLVECKSARVTLGSLRSIESEQQLLTRSLGKGVKQLNRTVQLIKQRRPQFLGIPEDRPIYGLIVTAELIPLANVGHGRYELSCDIPFEVIPLRDLSVFCSVDRVDPGRAVHDYFVRRNPQDPRFGRDEEASGLARRHPHVDAAWGLISAPFEE